MNAGSFLGMFNYRQQKLSLRQEGVQEILNYSKTLSIRHEVVLGKLNCRQQNLAPKWLKRHKQIRLGCRLFTFDLENMPLLDSCLVS
jgi:hypothetical protein